MSNYPTADTAIKTINLGRETCELDSIYHVKGDAGLMAYEPEGWVNETQAESFSTLYQLAVVSEKQARVVEQVAKCESPSHAPNRHSVVENCQE
ncbi:hypothetical protein N7508_008967 [Penicillium antarcticum]|uniref:uncharacterized protein n=1 Tax=Penicillium antarcticum TaxID=416450 RepID=UPI002388B681|nr:uncharacterized protein N7508_008967 [Penicillium antarcticum]KAJ5294146.1 hypothetical protein N7508_008967 [Penicillium antarcticum]